MRSPIYVESVESDSTSPVNLPIFISSKNASTIENDKPLISHSSSSQNNLITPTFKSKKSTLRLTKTTTTRTTTTSTPTRPTECILTKPISLVIKHDLPTIENINSKQSNKGGDTHDDFVETFEIAEKYPSKHRKFPKPPIIAYSNNLVNQNSENKSNFRTRRNSIVLNLDKYVVSNNKINDTNNKTKSTKMVNIPVAPKKYHTFNENETPSHKEGKNRIILTTHKEEDGKTEGGQVETKQILITKPIKRTGSNINANNCLPKPLARRPPKEFLSATITPSDSNEFKLASTRTTSRDIFNQNNNNINKEEIFSNDYPSTISPTMKSLPSYDEALKRVSSDSNKINKFLLNQQQNNNSNSTNLTTKSLTVTPTNTSSGNTHLATKCSDSSNIGSYVPSVYSNVATSQPVFKNRNALPNLHMQSNFKSLLVQPAPNNFALNSQITNNTNNSNNNCNNISSRVYFRPQDLNSSNRLIQIQTDKSNDKPNNDIFNIPKTTSHSSNITPTCSTTQIITTPIIATKAVKKLSLNVLSDESRHCLSSPLSNGTPIKENASTLPPTPLPVSRQSNLNDLSPPHTIKTKVIPTSTAITTTTTNNFIATKTSSITTTTMTTTTEPNFNSIKQRTPSPAFLPEKNNIITQVESPSPLVSHSATSSNSKIKTWSSTQPQTNKILIEQENKNLIRDRTPSGENRPQSSLTNWKSTATTSTLVSSSPFPSDQNLNKKQESPGHQTNYSETNNQLINIKPSSMTKSNDLSYNLSGKLVDAVKAAAIGSNNSVEDGLGLVANNIMPNLIKKSANSNKTSSYKRQSHVNLGYIEDEVDDLKFFDNKSKPPPKQQQQHQQIKVQKQQTKKYKNSLDDSFSSSFSTSSQSSNNELLNNNQKYKSMTNLNSKFLNKDDSEQLISRKDSNNTSDKKTTINIASKSSSVTTDTNLNNIFKKINTNKDSTTVTDQVVERPPGRLNYYDSDTLSEGFLNHNNHNNLKNNFNNQELHGIISDSPNLSDLSEGRFDDVNGGHRTSTPNMSKQKRSSSLSSPELKHIKKQIQDLEKMYHEILKIIDTDNNKNSFNSFSTSRSSSSNYSSFNHTIKDSKRKNLRSVSQRHPDKTSDIHYLKHRFNRMESHLTSLAKTVAQISVELKSMKSVENVIFNLKREIQELKNFNSALSNSNKQQNTNELLFRSTSEPHLINSINYNNMNDEEVLIKEITCNKLLSNRNAITSTSTPIDNLNDNVETIKSSRHKKDSLISERFRSWTSWSSSYTNPMKLKKLTKFFGQEPPMLRLFLQKLNYEVYAPNFESEHITITELPYLSEERLKQIGIPLGPRLRILQEAQASFRNDYYLI